MIISSFYILLLLGTIFVGRAQTRMGTRFPIMVTRNYCFYLVANLVFFSLVSLHIPIRVGIRSFITYTEIERYVRNVVWSFRDTRQTVLICLPPLLWPYNNIIVPIPLYDVGTCVVRVRFFSHPNHTPSHVRSEYSNYRRMQ